MAPFLGQKPARGRDKFRRGRARGAGDDIHHLWAAERVAINRRLDRGILRVEPPIKGHGRRHAFGGGFFGNFNSGFEVEGQRLLAKKGDARANGCKRHVAMGRGG